MKFPAMAVALPGPVLWAYGVFGLVLAAGLVALGLRGAWARTRGLGRVILLAPLFFAAPLAGFGTEHFTLTTAIAALVPRWLPWHQAWTYAIGAGFIAAGFSLATRVWARLASALVAATFFVFVATMDVPAWLQNLHSPYALVIALRELTFGAGALAFAAMLSRPGRGPRLAAACARYCIAAALLYYSFEQCLRPAHVPGVPLAMVTPAWIPVHALWTWLAAAVYAVAGVLLLAGRWPRAAAAWAGITVLAAELAVYVPIAVANRASLDNGFNYMADTLMFAGALLLAAGAMPPQAASRTPEAAAAARQQLTANSQ